MKIKELESLEGFWGFGSPRPYCIGDNVYKLTKVGILYKATPYTWHNDKFIPSSANCFYVNNQREVFEVK